MTLQNNFNEKKINASGIDVYTFPSTAHSFFLALYIPAGPLYERESERGYSHFLEHIIFRNINNLTSGTLYRELDRHGLTFSGTTYNELIQLSIQGNPKFLPKAIDILTLALSPLVITSEEFSSEKERVKREIREDSYPSTVDALCQKTVWKDTPLSESITGSVGRISKMSRKSLDAFWHETVTKRNVFFYLTGAFDASHEEYLIKKVSKISLPDGRKRENLAPVSSHFFNRAPEINIKRADYCKVKISFDADLKALKKPVRDILYDMLFGGDSSRMFTELSEREGYVYSFDANFEEYRDRGVLSLSFETSAKDFLDAFTLALSLIKAQPDPEHFEFAKVPYTENFLFVLDDAEALNWNKVYESRFLGFEYESLEDRRGAYLDVTFDDVCRGAETIFKKENLTVALKHRKTEGLEEKIKSIIEKIFNPKE
ncbi:MAG: insulinase family protein [Clostridia bacterium]|nr:insulinase family protein [Clostridia bacterium]